MRQTVANKGVESKQKDKGATSPLKARPAASERGMSVSTDPIPTPRSVRHIPLPQHSPTSPSQHLSMMEILSMQEAEKASIRDAAAKRSLQEIQQEQEFQQWWDQESRRVIEEEEQTKRLIDRYAKAAGQGRGKGRNAKGSKAKGQDNKDVKAGPANDNAQSKAPTKQETPGKQEGGSRSTGRDSASRGGGRGRMGRGGRGGARGGRPQGPSRDGTSGPAPPGQVTTSQS